MRAVRRGNAAGRAVRGRAGADDAVLAAGFAPAAVRGLAGAVAVGEAVAWAGLATDVAAETGFARVAFVEGVAFVATSARNSIKAVSAC